MHLDHTSDEVEDGLETTGREGRLARLQNYNKCQGNRDYGNIRLTYWFHVISRQICDEFDHVMEKVTRTANFHQFVTPVPFERVNGKQAILRRIGGHPNDSSLKMQ